MRAWAAAVVAVAVSILVGNAGSTNPHHQKTLTPVASLGHGRSLIADDVGPAADGVLGLAPAPGGEIRDGVAPPVGDMIARSATYHGFEVPGPHILIESLAIAAPLDISTRLPVVVHASRIQPVGRQPWAIHTRPGAGPLYVLYSDVGGAPDDRSSTDTALMLRAGGARIIRSRISRTSDAIHVDATDTLVAGNLIDGLVAAEGTHNDAIQVAPTARDLTVIGNRIENRNPQTSCLFIEGSDVDVRANLIAGGGWVIYGGAPREGAKGSGAHGLRIVDNVFARTLFPRVGNFGVVAHWNRAPDNTWERNIYDDGSPVASPGSR